MTNLGLRACVWQREMWREALLWSLEGGSLRLVSSIALLKTWVSPNNVDALPPAISIRTTSGSDSGEKKCRKLPAAGSQTESLESGREVKLRSGRLGSCIKIHVKFHIKSHIKVLASNRWFILAPASSNNAITSRCFLYLEVNAA